MKKISKSILTIGLTTSMVTEGFVLNSPHKAFADNISSFTKTQKSSPLKFFKASEVSNTDIQLATSSQKSLPTFENSLQNTLNNSEA